MCVLLINWRLNFVKGLMLPNLFYIDQFVFSSINLILFLYVWYRTYFVASQLISNVQFHIELNNIEGLKLW